MRDKIKCIKCAFKDYIQDLEFSVLKIINQYKFEDDLAILYVYAKHESDDMEVLYKWSYIDDEMKDINVEDLMYLAFMKGKDSSNKS